MGYREIRYAREDMAAVITLARSGRGNALTAVMLGEILDALERADADDTVRGVVVTGEGPFFCVGADVSEGAEALTVLLEEAGAHDDSASYREPAGLITLRIHRMSKPVIAAVNGDAIGGGVTIISAMDLRLASTQARFGFVFTRRGLTPEGASTWFLPRVVGDSRAAEWLLWGRLVSADEALAAGFVRSLHAPGDEVTEALRLIAELGQHSSPAAVAVTRRLLRSAQGEQAPVQAARRESSALRQSAMGADAKEGITAFLERRPARFSVLDR